MLSMQGFIFFSLYVLHDDRVECGKYERVCQKMVIDSNYVVGWSECRYFVCQFVGQGLGRSVDGLMEFGSRVFKAYGCASKIGLNVGEVLLE